MPAQEHTEDRDHSKLWEAITSTAVNVAGLTESVKAQHERIVKIEAGPAALRGWLGLVIAAGAGCLVPFAIVFMGLLAWLVEYALTHH